MVSDVVLFVVYTLRGDDEEICHIISARKAESRERKNIMKTKIDLSSKPAGRTDWNKVRGLSDKQIRDAAKTDPDAAILTDRELSEFKRVPDMKILRARLNMSQAEFAAAYHVRLGTVRDWEQHRVVPDSAARTLLTLIDRAPEAVRELLGKEPGAEAH